jgi:hypothetical protein
MFLGKIPNEKLHSESEMVEMPLTQIEVQQLQATQSKFGCGASACKSCYPVQYACDCCSAKFDEPIANGERFVCPECDWDNNGSN